MFLLWMGWCRQCRARVHSACHCCCCWWGMRYSYFGSSNIVCGF